MKNLSANFDCWYMSVCDRYNANCWENCIRFLEMSKLMQSSNIPLNRQKPVRLQAPKVDYDAFCRLADIKDNIREFVEQGKNLYITSETTGNGKTSWAIKLMLKYFDDIWPGNGFNCRGIFVNVPTFLLKCKDFNNKDSSFDELRNRLDSVDLVIWDDIGSTELSSYDHSQLLMYIDARCNNCKANIFTGNIVSREKLEKAIGIKLTSRVLGENTEKIEFKGSDKR